MNTSQNNKTIKINHVDLIGPNIIRLSTYLQIKDILNLDTSSKTLKEDYEVHVWKFQWKTKLQKKGNRNNYRQAVIQYKKNEIKKKKIKKIRMKKAETFLKGGHKRKHSWKSFASVRSRSDIWDRWEKMFENEKSKARLCEHIKKNLPLFLMEDLNLDTLDVKDFIRINCHNGTIPLFMWEEMTIAVDEWYIEDLMLQIENTKDILDKRKLLHDVEITKANLEHFYKKQCSAFSHEEE